MTITKCYIKDEKGYCDVDVGVMTFGDDDKTLVVFNFYLPGGEQKMHQMTKRTFDEIVNVVEYLSKEQKESR